jgi:hypothetical protein
LSKIIDKRVCAEIDGDFVLFLIGMRVNRPLKFWKWGPVANAMPKMIIELSRRPELGLLHARTHVGFPDIFLVQYWRSFDHLEAYARSRELEHLPAWQAFNKAVGTDGSVGIWHETYAVQAGGYESVYVNMPAFGLGRAGTLAPAHAGRQSAAGRLAANRT